MRIIFVSPSPFPYYSGGVETWLYNVIKRLCILNEIIIITPNNYSGDKVFKDIPEVVRFENFNCLENSRIIRPILRNHIKILDFIYRQRTFEEVLKSVLKEKTDKTYIVCMDPIFLGPIVAKVKKKYTYSYFITSLRGPHLDIISKSYPLFKKWFAQNEKKSLFESDLILANGYDTKTNYEARYNVKTHVLKNGVNIEKITNETTENAIEIGLDENSILSVATLLPIKGVFYLVDVAKEYLAKYDNNFKIYFIGKGNKHRLYKYALRRGVHHNIVILGHRDNPIPYMKKTRINICVSGGSGFSMSMLEAMAIQKPIIALDTPVYRQFNWYNQLLLTAPNSPEALASAIFEVFNNYNYYFDKNHFSLLVAKEFDWSIVVNEFVMYLQKVSLDEY